MKTLFISAACSDMAIETIALLKTDYRLVLAARDVDALKAMIASHQLQDSVLLMAACDVQSGDACAALAAQMVTNDIQLDGVVNFAGKSPIKADFLHLDVEQLACDLRTRVIGNINLLRALSPLLRSGASVVLVNGILSKLPDPDFLCGSLSTSAVRSLGKAMARTLAPRGIRVNTVNPCAAATQMKDRLFNELAEQTGVAASVIESTVRAKIPLGRLCDPVDVARLIGFLLSDQSAFITGTAIDVDGGYNSSLA